MEKTMSFKMTINLGNVKPSNTVSKELQTGLYQAEITKMEGKNPIVEGGQIVGYKRAMWVFKVINNDDFEGSTCLHSMNTPKDANDWIAKLWVDSLLSCGYDIEEIAEMTSYDESVYVGRECFIQYTHKSDNGGQYDKVRFIKSEEDYTNLKNRGLSSKTTKSKTTLPTGDNATKSASPKIAVTAPPKSNGDLNSLISGIGDVGF
jgi:hypothetical protein